MENPFERFINSLSDDLFSEKAIQAELDRQTQEVRQIASSVAAAFVLGDYGEPDLFERIRHEAIAEAVMNYLLFQDSQSQLLEEDALKIVEMVKHILASIEKIDRLTGHIPDRTDNDDPIGGIPY